MMHGRGGATLDEYTGGLPTRVLDMLGYWYWLWDLSRSCSSTVCATLNVSDTSLNRRFSVGTKPARKMLIPSRTAKGIVTTPYLRAVQREARGWS